MRRALAIAAVTLALAACALAPTGVFARVEVACGAKMLVFSNGEKIDEEVTVKATDQCAGADSELQLMDENGKLVESFRVPDRSTETIHVRVRSGQWLNFVCNGTGTEGSCWYSVTSK